MACMEATKPVTTTMRTIAKLTPRMREALVALAHHPDGTVHHTIGLGGGTPARLSGIGLDVDARTTAGLETRGLIEHDRYGLGRTSAPARLTPDGAAIAAALTELDGGR